MTVTVLWVDLAITHNELCRGTQPISVADWGALCVCVFSLWCPQVWRNQEGMLWEHRQQLLCLSQTSSRSQRRDKWPRGGSFSGDPHLEPCRVSPLHASFISDTHFSPWKTQKSPRCFFKRCFLWGRLYILLLLEIPHLPRDVDRSHQVSRWNFWVIASAAHVLCTLLTSFSHPCPPGPPAPRQRGSLHSLFLFPMHIPFSDVTLKRHRAWENGAAEVFHWEEGYVITLSTRQLTSKRTRSSLSSALCEECRFWHTDRRCFFFFLWVHHADVWSGRILDWLLLIKLFFACEYFVCCCFLNKRILTLSSGSDIYVFWLFTTRPLDSRTCNFFLHAYK